MDASDIIKLSSLLVTSAVAIWGIIKFSGTQVITFVTIQKDIGAIKTDLNEIKTNHLVHVNDQIGRSNDEIGKLRDAFQQHLIALSKEK